MVLNTMEYYGIVSKNKNKKKMSIIIYLNIIVDHSGDIGFYKYDITIAEIQIEKKKILFILIKKKLSTHFNFYILFFNIYKIM